MDFSYFHQKNAEGAVLLDSRIKSSVRAIS